jgi:plastocyanin
MSLNLTFRCVAFGACLFVAACVGEPAVPEASSNAPLEPAGENEIHPHDLPDLIDRGPPQAAPPPPVVDPIVEPAPTPVTPPTSSISLSAPSALSLRLNEAKVLAVEVAAGAGASGTVSLSVEGLPQGVTAKLEPESGPLVDRMSVKLTLSTASDSPVTLDTPLTVRADAGNGVRASADVRLTIIPELLITISKGVALGTAGAPNLNAFGSNSWPVLYVPPGTRVTFVNLDSVNHQIHSNGGLGMAHQNGVLQPNGANTYSPMLNAKGTLNFRCHIHPNMLGQIVVK